ncbi:hypothetical protein D3C75_1071850 [compost metagenome]
MFREFSFPYSQPNEFFSRYFMSPGMDVISKLFLDSPRRISLFQDGYGLPDMPRREDPVLFPRFDEKSPRCD